MVLPQMAFLISCFSFSVICYLLLASYTHCLLWTTSYQPLLSSDGWQRLSSRTGDGDSLLFVILIRRVFLFSYSTLHSPLSTFLPILQVL